MDRAEFGAKIVVTGEGELIWDVVNRKQLWQAAVGGATAVAITADGKTLATAESLDKVRLWDVSRFVAAQ